MSLPYRTEIHWSDEDQAYLVTLPEFAGVSQPCTHGSTYEEAARAGQEVLELLIAEFQAQGKALPEPRPDPAVSA
jgi:predicted RNase H-like HicB family nuclease